MKTPTTHPWKSRAKKVKARCLACDKEFSRDPEAATKTCSDACGEAYRKVRLSMHIRKGGFR
jgi:rRNA maturation endonuclease Nob1